MEHYLRDSMKIPKEWWNWVREVFLNLNIYLQKVYKRFNTSEVKGNIDHLIWRFGNLTILEPYANGTDNLPVKDKYEKEFYKIVLCLISINSTSEVMYKSKKVTTGYKAFNKIRT